MAATQSAIAISQLTGTGQSDVLAVDDAYGAVGFIRQTVGSTATTGATVVVQMRPTASGTWYNVHAFYGGTAADDYDWMFQIPPGTEDVRLDYTAPSGGSSHTCDLEVGKITA